MQAAETVYEFGSSPDEDDDNIGPSSSSSSHHNKSPSNKNKNQQQYAHHHHQQPTGIAGTNLRPNKTSSTSINQKLNTSFSSISDNYPSSQPTSSTINNNPTSISTSGYLHQHPAARDLNISASDNQLLLNESKINSTIGSTAAAGGSANLIGVGSTSNTSNTSLSSTTNSSRGNVSQSGNQSLSITSQKGGSGAHQPSSSSQKQNPNFDSNVISERVKNLATQIYQELKRIISRCNYDEDILSGLMPLIVRVLESLDLALIENQQLQVELELCKDDNEQLVIMFEKEKATKRAIDKKLIESEYAYEEERQQYQQKIESLDNIVKMFELKAKNASDQATRFEEKEAERKKEYNKLHDRYTELLKSHCDVVERFRHLVGSTEAANFTSINIPHQTIASTSDLTVNEAQQVSKIRVNSDETDLEKSSSLRTREAIKSWNPETELTLEDASLVVIEDTLEPSQKVGDGSSHNESERATSEPEGEHEKESENDSIAYTSMEKEFRKLIQENKDLLNTKNALNVVKDDLIAEVDRLTNEVSMYEQAVEQLNATKDQMKQKVFTLDTELRKTKEELEKAKQKIRENNEEGVPYSQRKRFGRAEMAKVLMERNNYKERYMELQDAVRYTELVRANKVETEKRSGLWKFFSNLFGAPPREPLAIGPAGQTILSASRNSSPVVSYHGSPAVVAAALTSPDHQVGSSGNQLVASDALQTAVVRGGSILSTNHRLSTNSDLIVLMDSDLNVDRMRALKDGSGRQSSDAGGYIHAYGWSLPASSLKSLVGSAAAAGSPDSRNAHRVSNILSGSNSSYSIRGAADNSSLAGEVSHSKLANFQVPIPQYCRPLTGDSIGMKIWCATAIDLSGGDVTTIPKSQKKQPSMLISDSPAQKSESSSPSRSTVNMASSTPIKSSNQQQALQMLEEEVNQALGDGRFDVLEGANGGANSSSLKPILKTTTEMVLSALPVTDDVEDLSTCVWICSTQHSRSKITIIDIKTKPNEMLDSFYIPTFLYCIKSIPGTKASDLLGVSGARVSSQEHSSNSGTLNTIKEMIANQKREFYRLIEVDLDAENEIKQRRSLKEAQKASKASNLQDSSSDKISDATRNLSIDDADAEITRILDNDVSDGIATLQKLNDFVAHTQSQSQETDELEATTRQTTINATSESLPAIGKTERPDTESSQTALYYQPISTCLSTVWMGGKDSVLYIHSAIGQWKDCVAYIKLRDSILQICHYRGRVFVALADGSLCVFFRNHETKQWEFSHYLLIDINLMAEVTIENIDLLETSATEVEARLSFSSTDNLTTSTNLSDQIRDASRSQNSSTTSQSNYVRTPNKSRNKVAGIRCLEIANKNLWIGYRNRVLILDPVTLKLKHTLNVVPQVDNQVRQLISMKDGVFCCLRSDLILRLYSSLRPYQHIQNIDIEPVVTRLISPKTFVISHITAMKVADNTLWIGNAHGIILTIPCKLVPQISEAPVTNRTGEIEDTSSGLSIARYVPKCDITNAQISFHGHKDSVKFFILAHNLMLSGGQGYLDFRLDMDDQSKSISDKSHVILWQLPKRSSNFNG